MSLEKAIFLRHSVRHFSKYTFDEESKAAIQSYIDKELADFSLFDADIAIEFRDKADLSEKPVGTYGVIRDAAGYLIVMCPKDLSSLLAAGYLVERIILNLVNLGVSSCWLGGTFDRKSLTETVSLKRNHIIPLVIPIGFKKEKFTLLEEVSHLFSNSSKRKKYDHLFFEDQIESPVRDLEWRRRLLCVRAAPSAGNLQPWRVLIMQKKAHFFLDRKWSYRKMFPYDIQMVDMGIAIAHCLIAYPEGAVYIDKKVAPYHYGDYVCSIT